MSVWYKSQCYAKPAEFDSTSSKVYVYQRRNIEHVVLNIEEVPTDVWQYEERKLSHNDFKILQLEQENTQLQLALTELYESLIN